LDRISLEWTKWETFTEARERFKKEPCIYLVADQRGSVLRIGKASKGLDVRYHGGNGGMLDSLMDSHRRIYVASTKAYGERIGQVESQLIAENRGPFNRTGGRQHGLNIVNVGAKPKLKDSLPHRKSK
jgi:hypothetical protein